MLRIDEIESAISIINAEYAALWAKHRNWGSPEVKREMNILHAVSRIGQAVVEIRKAQEGKWL